MKKWILFLICAVMGLSLVGGAVAFFSQFHSPASSASTQQDDGRDLEAEAAIEETVRGYLKNLKQRNIDEAYTYVLDDAADGMDILGKRQKFYDQVAETFEDEELIQTAEDYFDFTIASTIRDYTIDLIQVPNSLGVVQATVYGADRSQVENASSEELDAYILQYQQDHEEELLEMQEAYGSDYVSQYLGVERAKYNYEILRKNTSALPSVAVKLEIQLYPQTDGTWKIASIQRARS